MKNGEVSRTAEFNALFRAIESSRKPGRRLFDDHLAAGFLGRLKYAYLLSRVPLIGRFIPFYIDMKWPGVRAAHIGRTCWIDEKICNALKEGITQVVILGAGFDCRAYRLPGIKLTRVFELDHPGTQTVKIKRLNHLINSIPDNITMVEVDFNRQDFLTPLKNSGFDHLKPAFFLWEGVMHYLSKEAVDTILKSIASLSAPGSKLLFTYIHSGLLDGSVNFGEMGRVPITLRKSGEEWTFGLYPEELPGYLIKRGFMLLEDLGSTEYRALYMGASGRHLRGFEFYRVALTGVNERQIANKHYSRPTNNVLI
ncbi:MAG: class I SAM-dependent methyltransferase [Smithella sp.]